MLVSSSHQAQSDCNGILTHDRLVRNLTINHLAKLVKNRCFNLIFATDVSECEGLPKSYKKDGSERMVR